MALPLDCIISWELLDDGISAIAADFRVRDLASLILIFLG